LKNVATMNGIMFSLIDIIHKLTLYNLEFYFTNYILITRTKIEATK